MLLNGRNGRKERFGYRTTIPFSKFLAGKCQFPCFASDTVSECGDSEGRDLLQADPGGLPTKTAPQLESTGVKTKKQHDAETKHGTENDVKAKSRADMMAEVNNEERIQQQRRPIDFNPSTENGAVVSVNEAILWSQIAAMVDIPEHLLHHHHYQNNQQDQTHSQNGTTSLAPSPLLTPEDVVFRLGQHMQSHVSRSYWRWRDMFDPSMHISRPWGKSTDGASRSSRRRSGVGGSGNGPYSTDGSPNTALRNSLRRTRSSSASSRGEEGNLGQPQEEHPGGDENRMLFEEYFGEGQFEGETNDGFCFTDNTGLPCSVPNNDTLELASNDRTARIVHESEQSFLLVDDQLLVYPQQDPIDAIRTDVGIIDEARREERSREEEADTLRAQLDRIAHYFSVTNQTGVQQQSISTSMEDRLDAFLATMASEHAHNSHPHTDQRINPTEQRHDPTSRLNNPIQQRNTTIASLGILTHSPESTLSSAGRCDTTSESGGVQCIPECSEATGEEQITDNSDAAPLSNRSSVNSSRRENAFGPFSPEDQAQQNHRQANLFPIFHPANNLPLLTGIRPRRPITSHGSTASDSPSVHTSESSAQQEEEEEWHFFDTRLLSSQQRQRMAVVASGRRPATGVHRVGGSPAGFVGPPAYEEVANQTQSPYPLVEEGIGEGEAPFRNAENAGEISSIPNGPPPPYMEYPPENFSNIPFSNPPPNLPPPPPYESTPNIAFRRQDSEQPSEGSSNNTETEGTNDEAQTSSNSSGQSTMNRFIGETNNTGFSNDVSEENNQGGSNFIISQAARNLSNPDQGSNVLRIRRRGHSASSESNDPSGLQVNEITSNQFHSSMDDLNQSQRQFNRSPSRDDVENNDDDQLFYSVQNTGGFWSGGRPPIRWSGALGFSRWASIQNQSTLASQC